MISEGIFLRLGRKGFVVNKLLIPEHPIFILPTLAQKIGLYEAIFLQQLHYWLTKSNHLYDGRHWVYNSIESWHEQLPFISVSTIRRVIKKLEEEKILLTGNFNSSKLDRTKWYTIDYEALESLLGDEDKSSDQCEQMNHHVGSHDSFNVNTPIPETTTEKKEEEEDNARENEHQKENISPYSFFEQNGFGTIGSYIAEKIIYWCEDLSDELVIEAMKLAIEYDAKNWAYIESILRYWHNKGYQTVRDVHSARKAYRERLVKKPHDHRMNHPTPPSDLEYDINAGEDDDT